MMMSAIVLTLLSLLTAMLVQQRAVGAPLEAAQDNGDQENGAYVPASFTDRTIRIDLADPDRLGPSRGGVVRCIIRSNGSSVP